MWTWRGSMSHASGGGHDDIRTAAGGAERGAEAGRGTQATAVVRARWVVVAVWGCGHVDTCVVSDFAMAVDALVAAVVAGALDARLWQV